MRHQQQRQCWRQTEKPDPYPAGSRQYGRSNQGSGCQASAMTFTFPLAKKNPPKWVYRKFNYLDGTFPALRTVHAVLLYRSLAILARTHFFLNNALSLCIDKRFAITTYRSFRCFICTMLLVGLSNLLINRAAASFS